MQLNIPQLFEHVHEGGVARVCAPAGRRSNDLVCVTKPNRARRSMRKLANPPAAIKLVLEAVCVVLDIKPAKVAGPFSLLVCVCVCVVRVGKRTPAPRLCAP